MKRRKSPKAVAASPLKLDLSFGSLPEGFPFQRPDFDYTFPGLRWPLKNDSVEEAYCAYLLTRLDGPQRLAFMDELWRVLKPEAKVTIVVPYYSSVRAIQDPFHKFPPMAEQSFLYFNKAWREGQKLGDYCRCDFDFTFGYSLEQDTSTRPEETRSFWTKHYLNTINDLQMVLTKRP